MPITGSDRTAVALPLPVAHGLAPRLQFPRARDGVVGAEALAEGGAQLVVGRERRERALQRAGQRRQAVARGCVANDRRGRLCPAADAVRRSGEKRGEGEVRIRVRPRAAALDAPAVAVVAANYAHGARAVLD